MFTYFNIRCKIDLSSQGGADVSNTPKELYTLKEMLEYFKISRPMFQKWLDSGMPRIKIGRENRYDLEAIIKWLEERNKEEK